MKASDDRMGISLRTREYTLISSGISRLDEVLLGGFRKDALIHLYGDPGAGKTSFAIQVMVNIMKQGWRGIWVDCNGAFSLDRFLQMLGDSKLLRDLILLRPSSFAHQTQVIQQIQYLLERTGIIVVDPITHYYRAERYVEGSQGYFQELISTQLGTLVGYAHLQKIPVIVVNYGTRDQNGSSVPLVMRGFQRYERYRFAFSNIPLSDPDASITQRQIHIEAAPEKYSQNRTLVFSINANQITIEEVRKRVS